MSIIPDGITDSTTASVTAYLAFVRDHDADPSSWTAGEVREYSDFARIVSERVRAAEAGTWIVEDRVTHEMRRFGSALAATLWLDRERCAA